MLDNNKLNLKKEVNKIVNKIKYYNSFDNLITIHPDIMDNYLNFILSIKKKLGINVSYKRWNTIISSHAIIFKINENISYSMYPILYSNKYIHIKIAKYPSYI